MKKINISIILGGPSAEHEVSIKSANGIIQNIDLDKYNLRTIFISKKNIWKIDGANKNRGVILKEIKDGIVWPILHGNFGEDGKLQKILEKNKIKFIGSGSKSSRLAMDKYKTQKILERNGIECPKSILIKNLKTKVSSFPLILKPIDSGSSVDLYKVKTEGEYKKAIKKMLPKYRKVLCQEVVTGRELTCGVLERRKKLFALPATEIILTKGELFDYKAKYTVKGCIETTPAEISSKDMKKVQEVAIKVHKILGCSDFSRVDMFLTNDGKIKVLEINTIPGLTETSLIPQQLRTSGMNIPQFIDVLVENHIKKK